MNRGFVIIIHDGVTDVPTRLKELGSPHWALRKDVAQQRWLVYFDANAEQWKSLLLTAFAHARLVTLPLRTEPVDTSDS